MQKATLRFNFEDPLVALESEIEQLQAAAATDPDKMDALREKRSELAQKTRQVFDDLSAWQTVQVARHQNRPQTADYIPLIFDEFVELHGDRYFGDDRAMLTGFAKLGKYKVLVVGHQKGRTVKERSECYFGCAHPEGYRKALGKIQMAAKYGLPVICLIDTPGAYPGVGAEQRGQSQAIAANMFEMSRIDTPIICAVIAEGGSGGALGIGVGDRVAVMQFAYYSVISPEGCAGILWKSHEYAENAAEALRFTAKDLLRFGVVDSVIEEPLGGAHRDHHLAAAKLKDFFQNSLKELVDVSTDELLAARYEKFRRMGVFLEDTQAVHQDS